MLLLPASTGTMKKKGPVGESHHDLAVRELERDGGRAVAARIRRVDVPDFVARHVAFERPDEEQRLQVLELDLEGRALARTDVKGGARGIHVEAGTLEHLTVEEAGDHEVAHQALRGFKGRSRMLLAGRA
jgi:hypothetical protein